MKVLFFADSNFWGEKIRETGITIIPLFKKIAFFLKPLRILHLNSRIPLKKIWYNDWEVQLKNFDLIVLTAGNFTVETASYIENLEIKSNARLIYWYWDPVREKYSPDKISKRWEKWSFDKRDCGEFNLKYNTTYFFNSIKLPDRKIIYDVFFVGQNKGRLSKLLDLKKELESSYLKVFFYIVSDRRFFYNNKIFSKRISIKKNYEFLAQSKSILEIVQENQSGLTLRCMESLFFKKKLITNNSTIKNYDLYCRENVFILGEDEINTISYFLNIPIKILDNSIVEKYNFKAWMERLVNNIELER